MSVGATVKPGIISTKFYRAERLVKIVDDLTSPVTRWSGQVAETVTETTFFSDPSGSLP